MKSKKILVSLCLTLLVLTCWSQSPADSLSSDQVEKLREIAQWKSKWDIAREISVYILSPLSFIIGVVIAFMGLKNRIEKWAEDQISKKASEKFGLDWELLKQIVDEKKREMALRQARITIVGNRGKYIELSNEFARYDFNSVDYRKMADLPDDLDIATCDLIVIDNSDGSYKEHDVVRLFEMLKDRIKLVYLAGEDLSNDNFKKYRPIVKIIKLVDRLGDAIKGALT